jgi:hypothetical protein
MRENASQDLLPMSVIMIRPHKYWCSVKGAAGEKLAENRQNPSFLYIVIIG